MWSPTLRDKHYLVTQWTKGPTLPGNTPCTVNNTLTRFYIAETFCNIEFWIIYFQLLEINRKLENRIGKSHWKIALENRSSMSWRKGGKCGKYPFRNVWSGTSNYCRRRHLSLLSIYILNYMNTQQFEVYIYIYILAILRQK